MSSSDSTLRQWQSGIRAVESDALAPYALLAWQALPSIFQDPPSTPLAVAICRHLDLLQLAAGEPTNPGSGDLFAALISCAQERIKSDLQDSDPLTCYLAERRSELPRLALQAVDANAHDRAARTWADIRKEDRLSNAFDQHMIDRSTSELRISFDPNAEPTFVDVGGGPGQYSALALEQLPTDWRAIVVDEYSAAGWHLKKYAQQFSGRVTILARQSWTALPERAGVYLLASVLHNLNDAEAFEILRRCSDAAASNSQVFIVERDWDPKNLRDSSRDLDMRILFGGRERTADELNGLIVKAGLVMRSYRVTSDGYRIFVTGATNYA